MNENDRDTAGKLIPLIDDQEHIRFARLQVSGMFCAVCVTRIQDRLGALDGVLKSQVNQVAGVVDVIFDSNFITVSALLQAVMQAGDDDRYTYRAVVATTAESSRLSNTLARPPRRPHKDHPR